MDMVRGVLCIIHKDELLHEFTKKHPETLILVPFATLIDTSIYFMAEVKGGSASDVSHFLKTLDGDPFVLSYKVVERRSNQVRLLITRKQMGTLRTLIMTSSVLNGPIVIRKGVRYYPIITFTKNVRQLIATLKKNSLVDTDAWFRVDPVPYVNDPPNTLMSTHDILSKLSYMELKTLVTAYQLGYFNWPRHQSSSEVSRYLGISRSTFIKHLRDAERKIIKSLIESLNMFPYET